MKTIVLLHGWGMNARVFDELTSHLAPCYDVQALPLPGYEASVQCAPYSLEQVALRISGCSPSPCLVAGWSLGGQVALEWARLVPAQVEALVLLATTPSFVQRAGWRSAIDARVFRDFGYALDRDSAGTLKRFLTLQAQGDDAATEIVRNLRASLKQGKPPHAKALSESLRLLLDADLRSTLGLVFQHSLVIHGERDTLVPLPAAEFLTRALPSARLVVIRGAAHAPFLSDAKAVSRAILEFSNER